MKSKVMAMLTAFFMIAGSVCVYSADVEYDKSYTATQDTYIDSVKTADVNEFEKALLAEKTEQGEKKIYLSFRIRENIGKYDKILLTLGPAEIQSDEEEHSTKCTVGVYKASKHEWFQSKLCGENAAAEAAKISDVEIENGQELSVDVSEYVRTTHYKPWMLLYHMTSPKQLELGYYGGEAGQMMWTMAISPDNPDRMLIGSDTEGLWGSENGGVTWVPSNTGLLSQGTSALAFDPEDGNIVYVRGFTGNDRITDVSGIYKSTDTGFTWRKICKYNSARTTNMRAFAFGKRDANGNRRIYLIGNDRQGLFVSDDEGENWHFTGGLEGVGTNDIIVVGERIFVTTESGVLVSEDKGETWNPVNEGLPVNAEGKTVTVYGITAHPMNPQHIVCASGTSLYTSMDGGKTWERTCTSEQFSGATPLKIEFSAPKEDGTCFLYAYIHGKQRSLRTSSDNGKNFTTPVHHNEQQFLVDNWGIGAEAWAVHPTDPYTVFVSLDGEPQVTHDGGKNIYPTSSGYSGFRGTQICFNPDGSEYYMSYIDRGFTHSVFTGRGEKYPAMDLFPSEDRFWIREYGAKTTTGIAANWNREGEVWITIGNWAMSKLKKSTDGGRTFTTVLSDLVPGKVFIHPTNPDIVYCSNKITYDGGKTWSTVPYYIRAMSPVNGDIIYAREETCSYWSTDAGKTWAQLTSSPIKYTQQFTCDWEDEDKVYIGSFAGLTIVDNNEIVVTHAPESDTTLGKTKTGKSKGVFQYYGIAQDPNNLNHLVTAGNDQNRFSVGSGVWESFDGGFTWSAVEGMEGTADVWGLCFHPTESRCYMFTSDGTWVYECDNYYDMSKNIYRDIPEGYYAKEKIEKLYNDGYLYRYHDGYFRPEEGMKRGRFADTLRKMLRLKQLRNENTFTDVDRRNIYYTAVQSAFENGIISQTADGKFKPEEEISYDDVAVMLYNAVKRMHIDDKGSIAQMDEYTGEDIPLNIRYAVYQLKMHGIIDETVAFKSGEKAKNKDIAVMLANFSDILK